MITKSKANAYKPKLYFIALLAAPSKLIFVCQALYDPQWFEVMQEKCQALQNNYTWDLVLPTKLVKVEVNKWVFRIKYNLDGIISRYKAK